MDFPKEWNDYVDLELLKYKIMPKVEREYETTSVLPERENLFKAFALTAPEDVKVVILGQDPYPTKGNATGLAFSVSDGSKIPKSLENIYRELESDLHVKRPSNGNLEGWAKEGVLLLNSVLTVKEGKSASHQNWGWEEFTDGAIKSLSERKKHLVFILWGAYARRKNSLISPSNDHLVIESVHPSPLSAYNGFFGSKPFSRTNEFLKLHGIEPISWGLF